MNITSKNMTLHISRGVPYYTFNLPPEANCFELTVSTRRGGVSADADLKSLNLGTSTDDKWENVVQNYRIFCNATDYDIEKLVLAKQTHSCNVRIVTEKDAGKGVLIDRDYTDIDALITNIPGITPVIHTADCVPVALMDTKNLAIGNAHCGWRGTFGSLAAKTLDAMKTEFGTNAENIVAAIGPCICVDCYEVSRELYDSFMENFGYDEYIIAKEDRYYLNLPYINRQILIDAGVKAENIIVSDICTCCNKKDMFSHRGQGPGRGILGTFLKIKDRE